MAGTFGVNVSADSLNCIEIVATFDGAPNLVDQKLILFNPAVVYDTTNEIVYVKGCGYDLITFDNAKAAACGVSTAADIYTQIGSALGV